jgi:hypothetical protein
LRPTWRHLWPDRSYCSSILGADVGAIPNLDIVGAVATRERADIVFVVGVVTIRACIGVVVIAIRADTIGIVGAIRSP